MPQNPDTVLLSALEAGPILLFDGECGVCAASVQWILRHETTHSLRFAPLQSDLGQLLRRAANVGDEVDSLIWVERNEKSIEARLWSDAVLAVLAYTGGPWKFLTLLRFMPRALRNHAYKLFSSRRQMFAPLSCLLPAPSVRPRFLGRSPLD